MPDCAAPGKRPCGQPCTEHAGSVEIAWLKDCESGNIYYGKTYQEVRDKAKKRLQVKASGKLFPGVAKTHPISKLRTVPTIGSGKSNTGAGGSGRGTINVPPGSRFDKIPNNWQDTEKLLGDPEPDNDPGTVGGFNGNCFGLPIPCPILFVGGGALLVLLLAMR